MKKIKYSWIIPITVFLVLFCSYIYLWNIAEYYLNFYFLYSNIKLEPSQFNNLLLFSNSRMDGFVKGDHLEYAVPILKKFFESFNTNEILVINYAYPDIKDGINTREFEKLFESIRKTFQTIKIRAVAINPETSAEEQIKKAQAIYITGGNTFSLLTTLYEKNIMNILKQKIKSGTPFIGVSAGTVVHSPTIKTTNDMPVMYPPSFLSIGTVPFQINPHYMNTPILGFQGETRDDRIKEYLNFNRTMYKKSYPNIVVGLKEGSVIHISGHSAELVGFGTRYAEKITLKDNNELLKTPIFVGSRIDDLMTS